MGNTMRSKLLVISLAMLLASAGSVASAKGCLKGAAVGAVGGYFIGHHPLIGAAAGCVIGHHLANKPASTPHPPANLPTPLPAPSSDEKLKT
jgi:hypothetical protein